MAKKASTRPLDTSNLPLEGDVSIVGVRPRIPVGARDAAVADLLVTLTGGSGRTSVPVTFSISLNVAISGRAQLRDEGTGAVVAESTRSGSACLFRDVPVVPPGSRAARRYRITNLRANASGLGSLSGATMITAFVAASAPFRIALRGSQQNVATTARQ